MIIQPELHLLKDDPSRSRDLDIFRRKSSLLDKNGLCYIWSQIIADNLDFRRTGSDCIFGRKCKFSVCISGESLTVISWPKM